MTTQRRSTSHRRRLPRLEYELQATFNGGDQGYADAQVLDTKAEGVQRGNLTVVEADGTLALASNKCAFTAQGTPAWGDLGGYSQAITKELGKVLLATYNADDVTGHSSVYLSVNADADPTGGIERFGIQIGADNIYALIDTAAALILATPSDATDYYLAIVSGGYDVNGVPWRAGETAASYLYGASLYIKGGAFTDWTLLWRGSAGNTAALYAALSFYSAAGTLDNFRVPDNLLPGVLQPVAMSTFDAANGTSLDAITPEVGGAWTEIIDGFTIQGNQAQADGGGGGWCVATIDAGIADVLIRVTLTTSDGDGIGGQGIIARASDNQNLWFIDTVTHTTNLFRIVEYNGGGSTVRASAAVGIAVTTTFDVVAICDGQTIDAFLDGGNKITYGSATFNETVTKHGIGGQNQVTDSLHNNFHVHARTDQSVYNAELDNV